jgi:hypothetical protein
MQSFKKEISSWRRVFELLDQLAVSEEMDTSHDHTAAAPPFRSMTERRVENDDRKFH